MGIISELYALLNDDFNPAMEAEDITETSTANAEDAMGESGKSSGNHDLSLDTDNILTADTGKNTSEDSSDNGNDDETSDSGGDEMTDGSDEGSEDGGEMDSDTDGEEGDSSGSSEESEPEDKFSDDMKKKIWKNYNKFHDILSDTIDLVSKYVPNVSDPETIQMLTNVKDNLVEAKRSVFRILTDEYKSMGYPELLKKYIGLNHVYDLCRKQVKEYFDSYDGNNQKKSDKKKSNIDEELKYPFGYKN